MDICYIITINYLTHRVAFLSFVCSERGIGLLWVLLRGPIHSFACSRPPQVHYVHPRLGKCAHLRGQCMHNSQMLYRSNNIIPPNDVISWLKNCSNNVSNLCSPLQSPLIKLERLQNFNFNLRKLSLRKVTKLFWNQNNRKSGALEPFFLDRKKFYFHRFKKAHLKLLCAILKKL